MKKRGAKSANKSAKRSRRSANRTSLDRLRAELKEVGLLRFDVEGTQLYTPHQINAGVSWDLPWAPVTLAVDTTVALWSLAPSPVPSVSLALDASMLSNSGSTEPVLASRSVAIRFLAQ